ncbi:type IV pilin protein [Duganella qianjiadongensis]|uniref:Prepilin-type N-terminal cleavage/methylation domain-containing protein n=1 Tax=Duganella qianjiadongensis TaxID=2692176 RepID=A0ABW9VND9_9BURK|nr:type IV pilin protein [Duganella qianjiadongensis]MYM41098.1 prepilin-type N-terminal cleavage/methylation domain-containing protein [Duganella qianjiadongensis]
MLGALKTQSTQGFSLLELLVVLAISSILMALALPAYQHAVIRARRTEGQVALWQLLQQQERFYTQANSYQAFSASATEPEARQFKWWSGSGASNSAYEIEGKACDGEAINQCVQLIATPGTSRVDGRFRDKDCQQLILTSRGKQSATGREERCWP